MSSMSQQQLLDLSYRRKLETMYGQPQSLSLQQQREAQLALLAEAAAIQKATQQDPRLFHLQQAMGPSSGAFGGAASPNLWALAQQQAQYQEMLRLQQQQQQASFYNNNAGFQVMPPATQQSASMMMPAASPAPTRKSKNFPTKLMEALLLQEIEQQNSKTEPVFAWLHDGCTFTVLREEEFCEQVLRKHTVLGGESLYGSFVRKMNRWGFARMKCGSLGHCFHHKLFRKGQIETCQLMRCTPKSDARMDVRVPGAA